MSEGTQPLHRIDVHHHPVSPGFLAEIVARRTGQQVLFDWTPERSIEEMNRAGVKTAITSVAPPGVWFGDAVAAGRLARECNEYAAHLRSEYPDRFGMFAALPLPDIKGSLREIEYAFDVLRSDGIGLLTSYEHNWLGNAAFNPVMEELNRRKAVVYVHPTVAPCCSHLIAEVPDHLIEFAADTTRAIVSLMLTGTIARCPDIRFVFSHGGGAIPYIIERMVNYAHHKDLSDVMPQGPIFELQKFHYDTAFSANPHALSSLLQLVPVSQILYGTDFPFGSCVEHVEGLAAFGFNAQDLIAIESGNALHLFAKLLVSATDIQAGH